MGLKAKLVSTIAAICMVICLLSVGVWAASTATVNLGGTVSFTAKDVQATVKLVSISGTENDAQTKTDATFDAETQDSAATVNWNDLALTFKDKNTPIVITIKVINNNTQRALNVTATDRSTTTNYTVDIKKGEANFTTEDLTKVDESKSNEATYTITLKVTNKNIKAEGTLAVEFKLENVA